MHTLSLPIPDLPRGLERRARWRAPYGAGRALALAELARRHPGLVLVAARDTHAAHTMEAELRLFLDAELPLVHFPDWETLPYDLFSPHSEIVSQRIDTLYRLPGLRRGVLVVPIATLMQRVAPRTLIGGSSLSLAAGQRFVLADERLRLDGFGYRHVPQVLEPGDYATRGAVLDLFPMGSELPYRIELLDEEIDTIRTFDPETQRTLERIDSVRLLPGREFPLDEAAVKRFRNAFRERFDVDLRHSPIYQDLRAGTAPAGIEYYLPLFFDAVETLFDYLGGVVLLVLDQSAPTAADAFWKQLGERHESRRHDIERPVLDPAELYLSPEQLRAAINQYPRVEWLVAEQAPEAAQFATLAPPSLPIERKHADPAEALRRFLAAYPGRVLIAADSPGRREALLEALSGYQLRPEVVRDWRQFRAGTQPLAITVAALEQGVALQEPPLVILTEAELIGERVQQVRRARRAGRDPEAIIRDLGELSIGAPIVHEDHGVGRYLGLTRLEVGGSEGEFLAIEYARGDKLYVPVANLHLVGRYTGASPEHAPLHALNGEAWERAKKRAAERVRDSAAELLEIYAKREARAGTAIAIEPLAYAQFAAGFPFEETADQQSAIEAVLADLERPRAMDRVVCGDVGFGKTEVAVRAAFAVANAGRQVAVLVPTTLLAQQHFQNFSDRFADWPIRVEMLSRFRSKKEVAAAIDKLASGGVDIVIGTHKLLSDEIRFKDLGLVIIDEEQRFGVRHKEQFKKLRAEVDLLTLTATPIPRTLNMAMAGLRDLSLIGTPPAHRLAVETFVAPWDNAMLREAFQRELARGGQVYFLHNEVVSIQKMAHTLAELIPEARIRIAHGQMPERELEQVMLDFYRQRFNVLLCSTIIESGIDVANANTIIIHRADKFGLAQLHQLRGRVGRSHHRAYAYLLTPERKLLSADAEKRLAAIAALDELGAGFTLATHDLEIRGAGELLGEEQSGQIAEIGFSLYTDMLERAVAAIRAGRLPDHDADDERRSEVELHLAALIPDDYLPDVNQRLSLYKRIASARDPDQLRELMVEMIDRFGLLPAPVKQLFEVAKLKLRCLALGIRKLDIDSRFGRVDFRKHSTLDPLVLIRLVQSAPARYRFDGPERLKLKHELPEPAQRLAAAGELLDRLGGG
ncbi:MAG: transcription-repair coupling factor [Lysobacterales bacterium]